MDSAQKSLTEQELADRLVDILTVEAVEENFFRGIATPNGKGRAFGGQVIGQALMAATATVEPERACHSLHAYFMRPGDATKPVLYQVERDYDGRSFATRRVIAIQDGRPILNFAGSFHFPEKGLSHQDKMPDVPSPDELENEEQLAERYADILPERFKSFLRWNRPIELRPSVLRPPFSTENKDPVQNVWFRSKGKMGSDMHLNRAALAYASDMGLLSVSMLPHGKGFGDSDMQFASLDHAMWLHDDFNMNEWLLYSTDSPWAGGARGFNRGRIFTQDGRLVANVTQEGLVRQVTPKAK